MPPASNAAAGVTTALQTRAGDETLRDLVYSVSAKLTRPTGGDVDAWRMIEVTLPWLSILSNDPSVPKPRRLNAKLRKRLPPPDPTVKQQEQEQQVATLWHKGLPIMSIAEQLGLSPHQVGKIRTKLDLPKRRHRPSRKHDKAA